MPCSGICSVEPSGSTFRESITLLEYGNCCSSVVGCLRERTEFERE